MNTRLVRQLAIGLGAVLALVAVGPLLLSLLGHWLGDRVAGSLMSQVKNAIGLNPWQEAFWVVVIGLVAAFAIRLMLAWNEARITAGVLILTALSAGTYGFLWYQTRDTWFTGAGQPLKCYVLHGKTIRVRNMVAFDPDTGAPCRPVDTPELAHKLQAWLSESGTARTFEPLATRPSLYFSTFTPGVAVIWYFRRSDGRIELFDMPGYHPKFGDELLPVTRDIVVELERAFDAAERSKSVAVAKTHPAQTADAAKVRTVQPQPAARAEEPALARYVDVASVSPNATGVAYRGDDDLARLIIARVPQPISLLAKGSPFHAEGLFDRVLLGDAGPLRALGFSKAFRRMVVVSISAPQTTIQRELEGLTYCQIRVQVTDVDLAGNLAPRSSEAVLEGRGFSVAAALSAARTDAQQKIQDLLTR